MSFDRLAPIYRAMELVLAGEKLQRCRLAYLEQLPQIRRALLLGEGHGRFIVPLLKRHPDLEVVCVEASAGMLARTRKVLARSGVDTSRVTLIHADVFAWQPSGGLFDLIVTQFFLDCFTPEQVVSLTEKLAAVSAPDARWLVADFQVPDQGWWRWRAKVILEMMYVFFRVVTRLPAKHLANPDPCLREQGFQLSERRLFEWGLLRSDLWQRGSV